MPFRFWRRKKIFPGVTLNLSKSGLSTSFGVKGAHITFGNRGIRKTVGLPGTGLYYTDLSSSKQAEPTNDPPAEPQLAPAAPSQIKLPLGCLIAALVGSFSLAAVVCIGSSVSGINPQPAAPTLDLVAINRSAILTAWAPATLTSAARPTRTVFPTSTALPIPTFAPSTAVPFIVPTTSNRESIVAPYIAPAQPVAPYVSPKSSHPAGTSGVCVDGTYTSAQHSQGACSHHGGIATWWGP